jgi:molybdate transport system ATP-binding protein
MVAAKVRKIMSPTIQASFTKRFAGGPAIRAENFSAGGNSSSVTVLFGPSGSGKTTILRCLAGLERPEEGRIQFGDEVWLDSATHKMIPPRNRNIGFVPQDYALFPHLNVAANIGYGLHGQSAAKKETGVSDLIKWLGLDGLESRLPHELSGGQQQRVALARAVARRPRMLLLDEPLSALDAPTRQRLRSELRTQLSRLGIPTILVTHDRLEAAALGDQLVVMDEGRILQSGPVTEIFNRPASLAVARIVGTDTVLECEVIGVTDGLATLAAGCVRLTALADMLPTVAQRVYVCIRAEDVVLSDTDIHVSARNRLHAVVRSLVTEGPLVRIELDCGFPLKALLTRQACAELGLHKDCSVTAMIKVPQIHLISHT